MATSEQGTPEEKFWRRTSRSSPDDCWEWTGSRLPKGYGMFRPWAGGDKWYAHRFAVVHIDGREIPEGTEVDHTCKNKGCVNPRHLEVVHRSVNQRRKKGTCDTDGASWVCCRGHVGAGRLKRKSNGRYQLECRECVRLEQVNRRNRMTPEQLQAIRDRENVARRARRERAGLEVRPVREKAREVAKLERSIARAEERLSAIRAARVALDELA